MNCEPLFTEADVIHTYTRAQALADGALVDASGMAREAGITFPVALTAALHADIAAVPESQPWQSYDGRLWDVLWMLLMAITVRIPREGDDETMIYELIMHVGSAEQYRVKAVCGPGDEAEPVITLMQEGED